MKPSPPQQEQSAEPFGRPMVRITCMVHHLLASRITDGLSDPALPPVWIENARCVRQRAHRRVWGLPWAATTLDNAPMDIVRVTVPPEWAGILASRIIKATELRTPGHGMVCMQDVQEHVRAEKIEWTAPANEEPASNLLREMVLLTGILSRMGSGQQLASTALKLGAGVPVISRGTGTGIRDRLGLLRITIPPEKEIVRLIIPAHDADEIRTLLVEGGRMDRPGGGFLYQTPVREALWDPLLRVGFRQGHAASMEQIIAALDGLKSGTSWRKRFAGLYDARGAAPLPQEAWREISFICKEGHSDPLVNAGMRAGAGGVTTSLLQNLNTDRPESGISSEVGVLCVPETIAHHVVQALQQASATTRATLSIQTIPTAAVYTYHT